ncbi:MAG: tetratricopeptide repeat protein [Spirochaetes bacterium]|nr:tetratricopeptide repeat protein [Spirochaetota bacterium]
MDKKNLFFVILLIVAVFSCGREGQEYLSHYNKGKVLFLNQNLPKAIVSFEKAIKEKNDHVPSYVMLGKSYYFSGKTKEAKEIFKKLLKVKKNNINALNWLTRLEGIDERQYSKAIKYCDRVLEMDINNYEAHYYKGLILLAQDKIKEAILELNQAVQIEKTVYLAHLTLGDIYDQKGLKDKAREEYKKVLLYNTSQKLEKELEERIKSHENN